MSHEPELVRSALFVDFDNIYSGLREIDARAAERFAANPQSWLDWMEAGMPGPGERSEDELRRKILIRRCYLNPERFQRHRSDFTRAGFEVVDCPPLTRQGKTSTDIRMVMDILDTLRHETYFSEFILLSSDADFTPVLLRLRSMDRSTLTLTVGPAARAYRSACERVVDEVFFIEAGLGVVATMGAPLAPGAVGTGSDELFERMAASLRVEASARPTHEMTAAEIPPVYKRFPEFTSQSDWLGFFGLKPLTAHLTVIEPGLRIEEEPDSDWKWKLIFDPMAAAAEEAAGPRDVEADSVLLQHVTASVIDLVTQAKHPLDLATAANLVVQRLGTPLRESDWVGAGSFAALLKRLDLPGVAIDYPQANTPGFLYDPERFERPMAGREDAFEGSFPELAVLSARVSQVTGTPRLTPAEYESVFEAIETELDLAPFNLTLISKAVRDRCAQHSVSRSDVVFILRGIQFSGLRLADADQDVSAAALAAAFAGNVLALCADARMELSESEQESVRAWIAGAEPGRPATEPDEESTDADAVAKEADAL